MVAGLCICGLTIQSVKTVRHAGITFLGCVYIVLMYIRDHVTTTTSRQTHIGDVLRQCFRDRRFIWGGAFHFAKYSTCTPTIRFITTTMGMQTGIDFHLKRATQQKARFGDIMFFKGSYFRTTYGCQICQR